MFQKLNLTRFYKAILVILVSLVSLLVLTSLYRQFEQSSIEKREKHLKLNHNKAVTEFQKAVEQYSILVSALKSHINGLGRMIDGQETQRFINQSIENTGYSYPYIISFIDTSHTFIFSISNNSLSPNDLKGTQLHAIRDSSTIERMDYLLGSDELIAYPPINLYEGYVGFPIDFRVKIDNKVIGYIAPLFDMRNILDPIISSDLEKEFTYRFSYGDEVVFDREQVYNGSKIYHNRIDSFNLNLPKSKYLIKKIENHGLTFNIGIAYKDSENNSQLYSFVRTSAVIILGLLLLAVLLIYFYLDSLSSRKELESSNKDLSFKNDILKNFIYASSHDLKQPLVNINNFQSLLKRKYGEKIDDMGHQFFNAISDNIEHMESLLDNLLLYSEVIKGISKKEVIDLNLILQDILNANQNPKVVIEVGNLPSIKASQSQIHQLFQSLISNAQKFNNKEIVQIKITGEKKGDMLEIKIRDNGIGIKPEYLDLVFKQFQRLEKENYAGSGLGLAICKQIVNNHQGKIWGEGNELGGTDFIFQLKNNQ